MKEVIMAAQLSRCALCDFPLLLGCHLHHIIAADDRGPDHPLNLIALCPNHHIVVEAVRRNIAPADVARDARWQKRALAAKEYLGTLSEAERAIFDALSAPHRFREEIRSGVPKHLKSAFARDLSREDAALLLRVNRSRRKLAPQCATLATVAPTAASELAVVIEMHMHLVALPFERAWLDGDLPCP